MIPNNKKENLLAGFRGRKIGWGGPTGWSLNESITHEIPDPVTRAEFLAKMGEPSAVQFTINGSPTLFTPQETGKLMAAAVRYLIQVRLRDSSRDR